MGCITDRNASPEEENHMIQFDQVRKEALEIIQRFFRDCGGEWGARYLAETADGDNFDPRKAEEKGMSDYPKVDEFDEKEFLDVHACALRIYKAECPDDLRTEPEDKDLRARCDSYYDDLMKVCNGTLLMIGDDVKLCCCERFARELAYGKGFVMRSKYFPATDAEPCRFPDVLCTGYFSEGMSIDTCPYCGERNLLDSAECSEEKRKELSETVEGLRSKGSITDEEMGSYRYRMEYSADNA